MATPTLPQARSHYHRQSRIAAAAVLAIRSMFRQKLPLTDVARTVAAYQQASATAASRTVAGWSADGRPLVKPRAFAGVSSMGFPVIEPIIATIDRHIPAPVEPVPDPWWTDWKQAADTFMADIEQLIASEVADAGRSSAQVELVGHGWTKYVRILTPPSCSRCAILAGRIYRWSDGFERHPQCDCQMVPVDDERAANPLLTDPTEAIKAGQVRGLSRADLKAIVEHDANPSEVVNAYRGMNAPGVTNATDHGSSRRVTLSGVGRGHGENLTRSYKSTISGTTARAAWRQANPSRLYRLRPEGIYRWVEDQFSHLPEPKRQEIALQQLRANGYL